MVSLLPERLNLRELQELEMFHKLEISNSDKISVDSASFSES